MTTANNSRLTKTSFFKRRPTSSQPRPKGPHKCITNCTQCFHEPIIEADELTRTSGYDDLVVRKSLQYYRFSSVQFHPGQIYYLSQHMKRKTRTLYLLGTNLVKYESLLANILNYSDLGHFQLYCPNYRSKPPILKALDMVKPILVPVFMQDCSPEETWLKIKEEVCFKMNDLEKIFSPIINKCLTDSDYDVRIVPVTISKEVGRIAFWNCASVSVQILHPYYMSSYIKKKKSESLATSLAKHQAYDLHKNVVIYATNLIAFVLCYAESREVFYFHELVDYLDFFISIAPDLDMFLGFTGETKEIVTHALMILGDWIERGRDGSVRVIDYTRIEHHAFLVTPKIVNYAIIARSIVMGHNQQDGNEVLSGLTFDTKAPRESVLDIADELSQLIEQHITIRPPCRSITDNIYATLDKMLETAKYIKLEEPLSARRPQPCVWAGEYDFEFEDSDEEGYGSKVFLRVFNDSIIIDRLNMLINSIEPYLREE